MRKPSTVAAWSMLAIYAAGLAFTAVLAVANGSVADGHVILLYLPAFTAFMVVGALVVARRPANAIGWLFSTIGLLVVGASLASEYSHYAYVTQPGAQPFAIAAAWYGSWAAYPIFGLTFTFTLLLFPTGRLLSPRLATHRLAGRHRNHRQQRAGRPPADPAAGVRGPHHPQSHRDQRAAPPRAGRGGGRPDRPVRWCQPGRMRVAGGALPPRPRDGTPAAQVVRLRRRLMVTANAVGALLPFSGDPGAALTIALLPVAAGIAILRHRLYDIDRLINRTLVYGLLTAILGLGYAGTVLILGQVFGGVTKDPPSWAVAGATLAVAALFQPARRRIQKMVDRRFNRRKYDAAKTIEAFSTGYASRSTSTRSRPSCWPWWTKPWSQPGRPYGSGRRHRRQHTVEGEQASACLPAG
jgi:hypothetical protein